jgi:hypothetical protein
MRPFTKLAAKLAGIVGMLGALHLLAGCDPARVPAVPTVSLRLHGTPEAATVIVDEESLGPLAFVAARGVALPPGTHHVTVKAAGYFPSDQTVEAKEGSPPIELTVALVPIPD